MKVKVCMVGDAAVGKTSLVRRFVLDNFSDEYQATLGTKVLSRDVNVRTGGRDVSIKMMIWDIIGETSVLPDIGESVFHNVQGIVAVCDITRYSTFEHLPVWLGSVERVAGDVPKALAVNKVDLKGEFLLLYDEYAVRQYAGEIEARSYMTSAKTGENVALMFTTLAADIASCVSHNRFAIPLHAPMAGRRV